MAASWFGLTSKKAKAIEAKLAPLQLRATDPLDGSLVLSGFHHESANLAIDGTFQNSAALINEYRDMAIDPDVDMAVDDIINSIVVIPLLFSFFIIYSPRLLNMIGNYYNLLYDE